MMTLNPDQFTARYDPGGTVTVSELQSDGKPGRWEVPVGVIDYTAPSERAVPAAVEGMDPDEHSFPVTTEYGPQYLPRERPVGRRKPLQTTWLTPTQGGLEEAAAVTWWDRLQCAVLGHRWVQRPRLRGYVTLCYRCGMRRYPNSGA